MVYLGIDIGKRWHEAALLSEEDELRWRCRFRPTREGLRALDERLAGVDPAELVVGLEATGVYWMTLHAWLVRWGARVLVLNPLQTRALRNVNLRGAKSDPIDALAIARLVRWAEKTLATHAVPAERQAAAREVSRLRTEMLQLWAKQLVKLDTVLERVFPEFRQPFPELGTKSARAVLARWPTPALVWQGAPTEFGAVIHQASRGRVSVAKSVAKAEALRTLAEHSVGIPDPLDAAATAIRTLVNHLDHLEDQITHLAERLDALLAPDAAAQWLLRTIPGVGPETIRTWLAEMRPVECFRAPAAAARVVTAIGLDAQVRQSGQYTGRVKMSKRGNRYVRRALILAARGAARADPHFRTILTRQLRRGKHYNVAVSHVARKLVHVISSVLTHQRPYELPPEYRLGIIDPEPEVLATGT